MARPRTRKASTRDIAIETRSLALAHIKECDRDRAARLQQRAEDIQRQNDQHAANQQLISALRETVNRRFDQGDKRFDDLARAIGETDQKVDGEGAKRAEGWNETYKYVIAVLILALGGFLAFYFFGGHK